VPAIPNNTREGTRIFFLPMRSASTPTKGPNTRDGKEKTEINKPIFCGGTFNAWIILGKAGGMLASTRNVMRETVKIMRRFLS
jgi:hypothetical protein